MKSLFFTVSRATALFLAGLLLMAFSNGCSQNQSGPVTSYNNAIVQIQKDMLNKAQEDSKIFEQSNLSSQQILSTLVSIRANINADHDQFKAIPVPAGAEKLSDAMERFFQTETNGIGTIIVGVQQIQGRQNDPNAMQVFADTFKQFSDEENTALGDFYSTQQQVASEFGQKVVQVED